MTARIALPPARTSGPCGLESLLWRRRSVRVYGPEPVTLAELGQLLWAAGGPAEAEGKRTVPSAGALYPLRLSVAARDVAGLRLRTSDTSSSPSRSPGKRTSAITI